MNAVIKSHAWERILPVGLHYFNCVFILITAWCSVNRSGMQSLFQSSTLGIPGLTQVPLASNWRKGSPLTELSRPCPHLRLKQFMKGLSYIHALMQHGCGAPAIEPTHLSQDEHEQHDMHHDLLTCARWGVPLKDGLCQGQLLFNFDHKGDAFIWCVCHFTLITGCSDYHLLSVLDGKLWTL